MSIVFDMSDHLDGEALDVWEAFTNLCPDCGGFGTNLYVHGSTLETWRFCDDCLEESYVFSEECPVCWHAFMSDTLVYVESFDESGDDCHMCRACAESLGLVFTESI